jgi:hypothetical protein
MPYGYVNPAAGPGFTIEFWFKSDATNAAFRTFWNSRTQSSVTWNLGSAITGTGRQMTFGITASGSSPANAFSFTIADETNVIGTTVANWTDPSPSGYANDGTWHHVAFRLAANRVTWTVFLDGAVYATGNTSAPVDWKSSVQTFGAEYGPHVGDFGSNLWNKWLSYCAMYEKPLTDNRIFEHYTAGSGGTVYYGDDEVTRLHRIADWADVPEQSREFEPALVNLQGIQVAGTNALQAFQDSASAANGLVFADGQSRLVYQNRRHSFNRWNIITFAESTDSAPEVGLTFTVDDTNIYNDVRGDRPFGSQIRLVDDESKAAFGRKTFSFSIPVTTHEELLNAVSWISTRYREAVIRVSQIVLRAESSDLIEWAATGGVKIGDHITLDELPADAAPENTMEFIVEKIGINADMLEKRWSLTLELSPYQLQKVYQVGVSTLGAADKIAY